MSEAASTTPSSPYRGLRPYEETDSALFFGREAEAENVEASLFSTRLTLLYGPSGVGKSSVLLAGVAASLRRRSREDLADGVAAGYAVVVVRSWSGPDPLTTIADQARQAVEDLLGRTDLPGPPAEAALADLLDHWSAQVGGKLLVVFDQFEEYFLYHGHESGEATFDLEFPQAVNRADLRANFLLSIRDDALARLDRFKGRIPKLFENRLQVSHLGLAAAHDAVVLPIAEFNRHVGSAEQVGIEEELVSRVIDAVRTDRYSRESAGAGGLRDGISGEAQVETPILQVVLTALWEKEASAWETGTEPGPRTLRLRTFEELGGAERIVRDRLDERMARLNGDEQYVAANIVRYLVTPSGMKIAYAAADVTALAYPEPELAAWAAPLVESLLAKLADSDTRILKPVAVPGGEGQTRYEIFHDVLGPAILDWRTRYLKRREFGDAIRKTVVDAVLLLTTLWWLGWAIGLFVLGLTGDRDGFYFLIWPVSSLIVWIGWTRIVRGHWERRQQVALLAATLLAELAALTAPLSIPLVIVPAALIRRRRRATRGAPGTSPAAAGSS